MISRNRLAEMFAVLNWQDGRVLNQSPKRVCACAACLYIYVVFGNSYQEKGPCPASVLVVLYMPNRYDSTYFLIPERKMPSFKVHVRHYANSSTGIGTMTKCHFDIRTIYLIPQYIYFQNALSIHGGDFALLLLQVVEVHY